jgi:hypothetical protein
VGLALVPVETSAGRAVPVRGRARAEMNAVLAPLLPVLVVESVPVAARLPAVVVPARAVPSPPIGAEVDAGRGAGRRFGTALTGFALGDLPGGNEEGGIVTVRPAGAVAVAGPLVHQPSVTVGRRSVVGPVPARGRNAERWAATEQLAARASEAAWEPDPTRAESEEQCGGPDPASLAVAVDLAAILRRDSPLAVQVAGPGDRFRRRARAASRVPLGAAWALT